MLIDVTYAHNDDMGESIGIVFGIPVYADPRFKTLVREGRYGRDYIKLHKLQHTEEPEFTPETAPKPRELGRVFSLCPGNVYECWDSTRGELTLRNNLWCLHKDNGMSYWGYTDDEMQRILQKEIVCETPSQCLV